MSKSIFASAITIANSMIGSSMILFPVTFNQSGIIINVLFLFLMAFFMALTCKLLVDQLNNNEKDIIQSIQRRLSPTFGVLFGLLSSITLFLVSSVFFLLAVDVFYDVFLELFGDVSLSEKAFKLIIMGAFALLNYLPDLKIFFKLAPGAMGCLIISTLILIISIAFNTDNISIDFFKVKPLSAKSLLGVASINGFAFICHPSVSPIVQQHKSKQQKAKVVYLGYSLTIVFYLFVGILGALSIYGRVPPMDKSSYNIIDYYSGSFQAPVIGTLTFIYLFMISPIFPFVAKNQAMDLIPKQKRQKIPKLWLKSTIIFSVCWLAINVVFILAETSATAVIGFISTVSVYYITYFLPVFMSFKVGDYIAENASNFEQSLILPDEKETREETRQATSSGHDVQQEEPMIAENEEREMKAIYPNKWQKILYGSVFAYGSIMLVIELISFFV